LPPAPTSAVQAVAPDAPIPPAPPGPPLPPGSIWATSDRQHATLADWWLQPWICGT